MNKKMPAVVNYAPEPNSVELREVPVPEIGEEDVLLAVQAVGVCGTDIHLAYQQNTGKMKYPVIMGHEFGGVIAQVGKNVRSFKEGDRVVSETAAVIDENSPFVHRGLYNLDPGRRGFGFGVDGAMTHYTKVPERILHHIPATLPFEVAALTEPCCVAYNATCGNCPDSPRRRGRDHWARADRPALRRDGETGRRRGAGCHRHCRGYPSIEDRRADSARPRPSAQRVKTLSPGPDRCAMDTVLMW